LNEPYLCCPGKIVRVGRTLHQRVSAACQENPCGHQVRPDAQVIPVCCGIASDSIGASDMVANGMSWRTKDAAVSTVMPALVWSRQLRVTGGFLGALA